MEKKRKGDMSLWRKREKEKKRSYNKHKTFILRNLGMSFFLEKGTCLFGEKGKRGHVSLEKKGKGEKGTFIKMELDASI
ncbi:hypothetical protein [Lactiplantibacillus plantarum]|uniref:hypothetical protein n=1 Tax=Lactiplantibacillus plantarum TaxID=1590 RepID=UPI0022374842|nr:hypothetical protein [Lactiplantibacillus plantarum]MCW6101868.1 hypothetical protein [Lactiplantibacillus plantarum]MCW6104971.1 hypothetical protein [Lactiplantibacillus plantarum]